MASKSRRIANVNGAAVGPLRSVAVVDTSKGLAANAVKNAKRDQQTTIKEMLATIKQFVADSDQYQLALDAKQSDEILGRIASLLDEVKDSFVDNELAAMKQEILDEISGMSLSSVFKSFFLNQIANLFSDAAKKADIEELKSWMLENFNAASDSGSDGKLVEPEEPAETRELIEDVEKGDYKDTTPAENFYALQEYIQGQFDTLNENLKNIPGQSGMFSTLGKTLSAGLLNITGKVSSFGKVAAAGLSKTFGAVAKVSKLVGTGVFSMINGIATGVLALGKGLKSVMSGISGLGSKVGGFIATPFKKVGGFISKLNPFKKSGNDKKEDKKQKLKNKVMDKISNVIDKMWKVIEPFIDKAAAYMSMMLVSVVVPIAILVMKVLLITAAIIAAGVLLFLVITFIVDKVKKFINYVKSGQLWKDLKMKMLAAWAWLKDFGKWLWDQLAKLGGWMWEKICGLGKAIFIDFPIWIGKKLAEFGVWLWKQLKEFGKWLYDNYINKYVIQPLKQMIQPLIALWENKIQPVIQPFIDSLMDLKNRIVQAFSAWDTSKSIWENLKNIGGIVKDSVLEWWNESPFKAFYEQYLEPFVNSAKDLFNRLMNLGGFIKQAILDWWNGDSSLGDTLKNIGTIIMDTVKEWYATSPLKPVVDEIIRALKLYVIAPLNGIKRKIAAFIVKLADDFVIKIPSFSFDGWKPSEWGMKWNVFRPFDFATKGWTPEQKQAAVDDSEKSTTELIQEEMEKTKKALDEAANPKTNIDLKTPDQDQQRNIAAQQVQQAAEPLQQLDALDAKNKADAVKASQDVSAEVAEKENYQKLYYAKQDDKSSAILDKLNAMDGSISKKLNDPAVIPMYLPSYSGQPNNAMMESN